MNSSDALAAHEAEERLRDAAPDLLFALQNLYANDMDYIKVNNLSGAENNQPLRIARAAIFQATGKQP